MSFEIERRVAVEAVLLACKLSKNVQSQHLSNSVIQKEDKTPVTVADFGGQALVSAHLAASFPDDRLVGEESASLLNQKKNEDLKKQVFSQVRRFNDALSENDILRAIERGHHESTLRARFWTLDPIDGTKGFVRGDQYAVALALIKDGQVVLGVLGCPNLPFDISGPNGLLGSMFIAVRGEGAVMRGLDDPTENRISVSDVTNTEQARFCESFESAHSSHSDTARIASILGIIEPPVRMDSQAKYGVVARGDASIFMRLPAQKSYLEKIWDHAAGSIIMEEAGGKVTDLDGNPLDFTVGNRLKKNRGILATNGPLHNPLLKAIHQVTKDQ